MMPIKERKVKRVRVKDAELERRKDDVKTLRSADEQMRFKEWYFCSCFCWTRSPAAV